MGALDVTAIHCRYRPGGAEDRLSIRDVHLEYMMANADLIRSGGAIVEGDQVVGMFVLLGTGDAARVAAFLASEPYTQAGLFASVERCVVQQFMPEPHAGFLDNLLVQARAVAQARRGAAA